MTAIYLAGPDVFRPDAEAHDETLKALYAESDFPGLYPLDHTLPADIREPATQVAWIYRTNVDLIERADYVLANPEPFRGSEPDSGTALEVGYALALGRPVYAYLSDAGAYAERLVRLASEWLSEHPDEDRDGWQLEGFDLPLNLMPTVPSQLVADSPREALRRLAEEPGGNVRSARAERRKKHTSRRLFADR